MTFVYSTCILDPYWNWLLIPREGYLGGSAVEHLPLTQGMILKSLDRVPRRAPCMEPASPSACISASLCVSHE